MSEAGKLPGDTKDGQRERGEALEAKSSFASRQVADREHSSPMWNGNGIACLRVKHFRWESGGQTREDALARAKVLALHVLADQIEHGESDAAALNDVVFGTGAGRLARQLATICNSPR